MTIRPARLALYAGLAAFGAAMVLAIIAAMRESSGGAGENIEWFLSYLLVIGFPTTLVVAVMRPVFGMLDVGPVIAWLAMILAVTLNWVLIAYGVTKVVALVGQAFRSRASPESL